MENNNGPQGNVAKIIFVALIVIFAAVVGYFKFLAPDSESEKQIKETYSTYIKTEAEIVSTESNGRVGKGSGTILTLQFKDQKGNLLTKTDDDNGYPSTEKGSKVTIYYNPENPNELINEHYYNEIMDK